MYIVSNQQTFNLKFHNNHFKSSQSTIKHQVQSYIIQSTRTITKCMQQLLSYSDQENSSLGCCVIRCNCWLLHGTLYLVSIFLHFGVADTS